MKLLILTLIVAFLFTPIISEELPTDEASNEELGDDDVLDELTPINADNSTTQDSPQFPTNATTEDDQYDFSEESEIEETTELDADEATTLSSTTTTSQTTSSTTTTTPTTPTTTTITTTTEITSQNVPLKTTCPSDQLCRPIVMCAAQYLIEEFSENACSLNVDIVQNKTIGNGVGLCCKDITSTKIPSFLKPSDQDLDIQLRPRLLGASGSNRVSNEVVVRSATSSQTKANNITLLADAESRHGGNGNKKGTPEYLHGRFQRQRDGVFELGQYALQATLAAKAILKTAKNVPTLLRGSPKDTRQDTREFDTFLLRNVDTKSTFLTNDCPGQPSCSFNSTFRKPDGSCNNEKQSKYGMSSTPLRRYLPNKYSDGLTQPRLSKGGNDLPLAKIVSNKIFKREDAPNPNITVLFVAFGQFLDHDLDHVPVHKVNLEGRAVECCGDDGPNSLEELSDLCLPIIVPPFIGNRSQEHASRTCINFVRSVPAPSIQCTPGAFEQMNQITHWLDNSNVYGSDKKTLQSLRSNKVGLMTTSTTEWGDIMLPEGHEPCRNGQCMLSGDLRNNEQPALGALHLLLVKEHNRVATKLNEINPSWTDERLFQNARRIVNAEWQHIVFNEFLPILMGQSAMDKFGLRTLTKGFSRNYRDDFDPSVSNAFSAAAFRVGHTMMAGFIKSMVAIGDYGEDFKLRDLFENVAFLRGKGVFDTILRGLTNSQAQTVDNNVVSDLIDHLFDAGETGLDLIAFNIQRSRDHGLPGYVEYRSKCQLGEVKSFGQLSSNIEADRIEKLSETYKYVEDIDLFVGMIMETPKEDALVGETFLCLIGDTFSRVKFGDRFFYDLEGQAGSFTIDQLNEIRKTSLSRLICDNCKKIDEIQPLAMRPPNNETNPITRCDSDLLFSGIPSMDYSVFSS